MLRGSFTIAFLSVVLGFLIVGCGEDNPVTPPVLELSPTSIDLSEESNTVQFRIINSGEGILHWRIENIPDWLSVEPTVGETTSETVVNVALNMKELEPWKHEVELKVISNESIGILKVSVPCDKSIGIVPGKSVSCVTFDMDAKQVKNTLGNPEESRFDDSSERLEYYYPGMVITFANKSGSAIEEIFLESGYTGKTVEGIGIGSKRDEVHTVYGKPEKSGYLGGNASLPADVYTGIGMQLVYSLDVSQTCTSTFDYDAFGRPIEHRTCTDVQDNSEVLAIWIFKPESDNS